MKILITNVMSETSRDIKLRHNDQSLAEGGPKPPPNLPFPVMNDHKETSTSFYNSPPKNYCYLFALNCFKNIESLDVCLPFLFRLTSI